MPPFFHALKNTVNPTHISAQLEKTEIWHIKVALESN